MINFLFLPIVFLLSLQFTRTSYAVPECTSPSTVINETLYRQNPSSQGALGVCYAHSVANIYGSLYQQTHGEFVFPSPTMLSIFSGMNGYKAAPFKVAPLHKKIFYLTPIFGWEAYLLDKYFSKKKGLVDRVTGGFFVETLNDAVSTPPCTLESVEWFLEIQSKSLPADKTLELYYEFIKYLKDVHPYVLEQGSLDSEVLRQHMKDKGFDLNYEIMEKFSAIHQYIEDYGFAKNHVTGKTFAKRTLANFLMHRCHEFNSGRVFGEIKYKVKSYLSIIHGHAKLIRLLDQHFTNAQSLPVEMGYCYGHLTDKDECGYHSSVIYGKTCYQDRLYFLVRNSWGGTSLRESNVIPGTNHSRKGDYWISTSELKKSWTGLMGELNFVENLATH